MHVTASCVCTAIIVICTLASIIINASCFAFLADTKIQVGTAMSVLVAASFIKIPPFAILKIPNAP
jgi:uncharacterized membrane protein